MNAQPSYVLDALKFLQRLFLSCALLINYNVALAALPVLVIATNDFPPYVSTNPKESFLTDLLVEVGNEMGVRFEYRFMPWPRCELSVDTLQVWAAMPYVPTPEREQKFVFSESLYAKKTVFFQYSPDAKRAIPTFENLSELKSYKMGGVRGYYYEEMFAKAGIDLDLANSEEQSFIKLRAGRVDMVPAVDLVGWQIIQKTFPVSEQSNFYVLETPLAVGHNYLMTSRRYPEAQIVLERFNKALAKLRRSGVYKQVADRHGVTVLN